MKHIRLILSSTFALLLLILLFSLNHQNVSAQVSGPIEQPTPTSLVITNTLPLGDDQIHGLLYDNGFLWAATRTSPARILKINPTTLQVESRVTLDAGLNNADAIAAAGGYIWAVTFTDPARLIRVDPATMNWITAINFGKSTLIDGESLEYAFGYLWVGGLERLARVDINDPISYVIYDFEYLNQANSGVFVALAHDANYLWGAYSQYSNTSQSFYSTTVVRMNHPDPKNAPGTVDIPVTFPDDMVNIAGDLYLSSEINPVQTTPSNIYKVPGILSPITTKEGAAGSASYGLFQNTSDSLHFWGVYVGTPGIVKKFDLAANPVQSIILPPGFNDPNEMAFDASGNVYVSTWQSPSKIVKYTSQYFNFPADLSLGMLGQPASVKTGDTLSYTLNVHNNSLNDATSVQIIDTLPAGVSFLSSSLGSDDCQSNAGQVTCSLGTLAASSSVQITLQVQVGSPAGTNLHNIAQVNTVTLDPDDTNNQAAVDTTYVPPSADLSLTMLREPATVKASDFMTYTITAANQGPDAAPDVKVIDTLPAGVSFISSSPGTINCLNQAGQVTCSVGTLAASASAQITLRVQVVSPAGTSLHNTAEVTANVSDPVSSNNQAAVDTTYVPPSADLSLVMLGVPGTVTAGDFLTYTITTSNQGPDAAPDVKIIDTLPAGVSFISSLPASIVCQNQAPQVTCSLGTLVSGESVQVTLRVQVGTPGGSTLHNSAQVSANVSDPVNGNNQASVDTAYVPGNPPGNPRVYLPVMIKIR